MSSAISPIEVELVETFLGADQHLLSVAKARVYDGDWCWPAAQGYAMLAQPLHGYHPKLMFISDDGQYTFSQPVTVECAYTIIGPLLHKFSYSQEREDDNIGVIFRSAKDAGLFLREVLQALRDARSVPLLKENKNRAEVAVEDAQRAHGSESSLGGSYEHSRSNSAASTSETSALRDGLSHSGLDHGSTREDLGDVHNSHSPTPRSVLPPAPPPPSPMAPNSEPMLSHDAGSSPARLPFPCPCSPESSTQGVGHIPKAHSNELSSSRRLCSTRQARALERSFILNSL